MSLYRLASHLLKEMNNILITVVLTSRKTIFPMNILKINECTNNGTMDVKQNCEYSTIYLYSLSKEKGALDISHSKKWST